MNFMKEKITGITDVGKPEIIPGAETLSVGSVGIVGHGHFGQLLENFAGRFIPETPVRIFSPERPPDATRFFSLENMAKCDAIVLAVPIRNTEQVLKNLLAHLQPHTVLIDIATIKSYTSAMIKSLAPQQPFISMHPMFGPEAYRTHRENVSGFRIVVTDHNLPGEIYKPFSAKLKSFGFEILHMSAEEHDKLVAESLFLTHTIAQIVSRAGFGRTAIDAPSCGWLMDAVESVSRDTELFLDVYRFNKAHCDAVLERLGQAGQKIQEMLESQLMGN